MKKIIPIVMCTVMSLLMIARGEKAPTWQEQYDLGVRYLSDGNYEEAIIAFTAAIEIEPKQAPAYVDLADAYIAAGDTAKAESILRQGLAELPENDSLLAKLAELTPPPEPTPADTVTIAGTEYPLDITELYLSDKGLTDQDIANVAMLTNLKVLKLDGNQITDVSPLAGLTNLTELSLVSNQIIDLSPLAGLTNLENLDLYDNQITDLSPLAGLTNLTELHLGINQINDLSPLTGLTNLTELWLYSNQITDLSPLAGLTNLKDLSLDGNQITDVSPLAGLTNLTVLRLYSNQITDLSPLAGLTNLTELVLSGNESEIQVDELQAALPNCEIYFWG